MTLPQVRLRAKKMNNHPWIYHRMADPPTGAEDGSVVDVVDRDGRFVGRGFYNSKSQIMARILTRDRAQEIDRAFLEARIRRAAAFRTDVLRLPETTNAYRVVNSEGDDLSGLVCDLYNDHLAIEVYSLGFYRRLAEVTDILKGVFKVKRVVARADLKVQEREGFTIPKHDGRPIETVIEENGLRFKVNLSKGHKTGYFLDQRENRRLLSTFCREADVLDCFSYTGGFALYAAIKGGARRVTAVDLDEKAIEVARENARFNSNADVRFVHADVFRFLKDLEGETFDVVILDPAKLAPSRSDLPEALKKYHDLNRLALKRVRPGGILLTCSCSGLVSDEAFLQTVERASRSAASTYQVFRVAHEGPDHPFLVHCREGRYLKAVFGVVHR